MVAINKGCAYKGCAKLVSDLHFHVDNCSNSLIHIRYGDYIIFYYSDII